MMDACKDCLRRSWLLAAMSRCLEYRAHDRGRLLELLSLDDQELVQAIGGKRREELRARYARFGSRDIHVTAGIETICHHHHGYPRALAGDRAPRMLYVAGGTARLQALGDAPTVAIVGSRRATDYGMEMASSLARGLAASGVTVVASMADGIALAAHAGALEVDGKTLTAMESGLDVPCPARRRALYLRVRKEGCAVAELPCSFAARRNSWCHTARERVVVGMAELTIVVEADENPIELLGARIAKSLGRGVAAVPGRVTSPVSRGTHALLMAGVPLVRGPEDVLELLYRGNPLRGQDSKTSRIYGTPKPTELEPRLKETLELVGIGKDTPTKLTADSVDAGETLLALSELELMGLLTRGDGGRYVQRESLAGR
jgi:DNA processing protein